MLPRLSMLKQYQSLFSNAFCETPTRVYRMVKGNSKFSRNNSEVQKWEYVDEIKGEIGPRLRREASIQNTGVNDAQGEIIFITDFSNKTLIGDSAVIKVGNDWFNIRFDLNQPVEQEPLAMYVAEKRSSPPPL